MAPRFTYGRSTVEFAAQPAAPKEKTAPYAQRRRAANRESHRTLDKGHGRLEKRQLTSITSLNNSLDWPGVQQVCLVERERVSARKRETEVTNYVTSLSRSEANAERLLELSRRHCFVQAK